MAVEKKWRRTIPDALWGRRRLKRKDKLTFLAELLFCITVGGIELAHYVRRHGQAWLIRDVEQGRCDLPTAANTIRYGTGE